MLDWLNPLASPVPSTTTTTGVAPTGVTVKLEGRLKLITLKRLELK